MSRQVIQSLLLLLVDFNHNSAKNIMALYAAGLGLLRGEIQTGRNISAALAASLCRCSAQIYQTNIEAGMPSHGAGCACHSFLADRGLPIWVFDLARKVWPLAHSPIIFDRFA